MTAPTTPPTIEQLAANYADKLGAPVGITPDADDRTPHGFPNFLQNVANRLSPIDHNRGWLTDTANGLRNLDDLTPNARARRLRAADSLLWDTAQDLANH